MTQALTVRLVNGIIEERKEPAKSIASNGTQLGYVLQDHIDVDAIRKMIEHKSDSWELTFNIPEGEVMVAGDGSIHVEADGHRTETKNSS